MEYINSKAVYVDKHTVELTNKRGTQISCVTRTNTHTVELKVQMLTSAKLRTGETSRKTAERFIIATGGRPNYLGIPNDRSLSLQ